MTLMGEKMLAHPAAEIFPVLEGPELDALADDIKANGQRLPIVLHSDGRILDGRNRHAACLLAKKLPVFAKWSGLPGTEIDYVISQNLRRRHLSESQRAMVAAKIKLQYALKAKERQGARTDISANLREGEAGKSSEHAAEELNVSARSVDTAAKVLREGVPELVAAVEKGDVSVHAAAVLTELPPAKQTELVAHGEAQILAMAKEIKERRRQQGLDAMLSSESVEHFTPDMIVELARRVMGGIDLDPASCEAANRVVRATKFYTEADDGLKQKLFGKVWSNPPFGRTEENKSSLSVWTAFLIAGFKSGDAEQLTVLVTSATGDKWFQPLWEAPICFPDSRLDFWTVDENGHRVEQKQNTKSSAIAYFGPNVEAFAREFSMIGRVSVPARLMTQAIAEIGNVAVTVGRAKEAA